MRLKAITVVILAVMLAACGGKYRSMINDGKSALEKDKVVDAIGYFEKAIKIQQKAPDAYFWLAMANMKRMRYGEFVINMNKTLLYGGDKFKSDVADAYYDFARELENVNRIENMYDAFEKIVSIAPDYDIGDDYALHLGNKYYEEKFDYQKALTFYLVVMESEELPREIKSTVKYRICKCYYEMRDYNNANIYYNQLLEEYPQHPKKQIIYFEIGSINYNLSKDAFDAGDYNEALQRGLIVLRIGKPNLWMDDVRRIVGDSYLKLGDKEKALDYYREIVKNDPYRKQRNTLYAMKKINELT